MAPKENPGQDKALQSRVLSPPTGRDPKQHDPERKSISYVGSMLLSQLLHNTSQEWMMEFCEPRASGNQFPQLYTRRDSKLGPELGAGRGRSRAFSTVSRRGENGPKPNPMIPMYIYVIYIYNMFLRARILGVIQQWTIMFDEALDQHFSIRLSFSAQRRFVFELQPRTDCWNGRTD